MRNYLSLLYMTSMEIIWSPNIHVKSVCKHRNEVGQIQIFASILFGFGKLIKDALITQMANL